MKMVGSPRRVDKRSFLFIIFTMESICNENGDGFVPFAFFLGGGQKGTQKQRKLKNNMMMSWQMLLTRTTEP